MYCVYLTIYTGNKLPPFYIGSSSVKKIEEGYHGSVSSKQYKNIWWKEIKNTPHLFITKIISLHKTRQEATEKEYKLQVSLNIMKKSTMYINRAVANVNGYFGRNVSGELNPMYSKKNLTYGKFVRSKYTLKKMSEASSGSNNANYGTHRSEEIKRKIAISNTGQIRSSLTRKKLSISKSGEKHPNYGKTSGNAGKRYKWITNEIFNQHISINDPIPEGWRKGRNMNLLNYKEKNVTIT